MGWGYGIDENGREVGYGVLDTCNFEDCKEEIDRGLGYRCGGAHNLHEEYGCGDFFCGKHLSFGEKDQVCSNCLKKENQ